MLRRKFVGCLVAAVSFASIAGCVDTSGPSPDDIAGVLIFTTDTRVGVGQTLQLSGRAVTYGGTRVDERVTWRSTSTATATVSSTGLVTGVAAGSVTIVANVGNVSDGVLITVQGASQ